MSAITQVCGLEICDSHGNPTVAAAVTLASGARDQAAAPSGAPMGSLRVDGHRVLDAEGRRVDSAQFTDGLVELARR